MVVTLVLVLSFASAIETIPPDSIRPGMKGHGFSVFSGRNVERFEVEVIDVMPNITPHGDLILARLSGAGLDETGVIAGMSGSPVYLEGRLAGAVAYAWAFAKEPIAGITPIGEMLDIWQAPAGARPRPQGSGSGYVPPGGTLRSVARDPGSEMRSPGFGPVPIPVALSGYSPKLAELVRPALAGFGLVPLAAGGALADYSEEKLDSLLVPGGAVGIALVDGDVRLSAIGTLTHREGRRVLAFGHPMFQAGAVELPMVAGVIHSVLPSLAVSFKLFSPSRPVGTVFQDRRPGIAGTIGPVPEMIPVRVTLNRSAAETAIPWQNSPAAKDTYRYRVVRHPALAGIMTAIGLAEVMFSTEGTLEDMTLASEMRLTIEDTTVVTVRHRYAGEGPAAELYRRAAQELEAVLDNRFRAVELTGIEFKLDFTPGQQRCRIASCRLDRSFARPGDSVAVHITLKDRLGKETTERRSFRLPGTTPAGRLTVVVSSRDSLEQREATRSPSKSEPRTLAGLFRLLESRGSENEMVIAGYIPAEGIVLGDRELAAPPPSFRSLIAARHQPVGATSESKLFEKSFIMDKVLVGTCELTLEVRR